MSYERTPNNPHNLNSLLTSRDGQGNEAPSEQEGTFQQSYADPAYQPQPQQQQQQEPRPSARPDGYPQYESYEYASRDSRGREYAPPSSQHYGYADAAAPQYQRESNAPRYAEYPEGYDRRDYDYAMQQQQPGYGYGYEYDRPAYAGDYYYQQYEYPVEYGHPASRSAFYEDRHRREYQQGSVPPQPQPAVDRAELRSPDRSQQAGSKYGSQPPTAYAYDGTPHAADGAPHADGSYAAPPGPAPAAPSGDRDTEHRPYRYAAEDPRYQQHPPEYDYRLPAETHTQVFQRGAVYEGNSYRFCRMRPQLCEVQRMPAVPTSELHTTTAIIIGQRAMTRSTDTQSMRLKGTA
ncbi:hypothetical protein BX667DRAFT_280600 [Coemansia mojavensis]|nr:hypothetical protein BX667DRAFT_280600 [Coemansia mojavensis]